MASLVQQKGYFYAQFYDSGRQPKRKQVSLKTRTRRTAQRALARLEDEYALGEYDPWRDKIRHEDAGEQESPSTLGEAVEAFVDTRRNYSEHTVLKYESVLGMLCNHASPELPAQDLTSQHVQSFLDERERAPDTKKSYSNQVKAFCNWLIRRGTLEKNPVDGVVLPRVPRKHPQYLEPGEVKKLVEVIDGAEKNPKAMPGSSKWLVPIVRANVYLGLRLREVVNLRWRQVDLDARRLQVGSTEDFKVKGGRDRTLPLCESVLETLDSLGRRCEYVFPNHGGNKLHPQYLSRRFKHYVRKAGLPEHVSFHTTRHTALSWLAMKGASTEAVRLYAGHSSVAVTEKYMHLSPSAYHDQVTRAFD